MKSTWSSNPFSFTGYTRCLPDEKRREEENSSLAREHVSCALSLAKLSMLIRFSRPFSVQLLAVSRCRQSWLGLSRGENGRTRTNREKQFLWRKSYRKLFSVPFHVCAILSTLCSYGATHDDIVKSISQKRSKGVTKKLRQRKKLWDNRQQTSENLEKIIK